MRKFDLKYRNLMHRMELYFEICQSKINASFSLAYVIWGNEITSRLLKVVLDVFPEKKFSTCDALNV